MTSKFNKVVELSKKIAQALLNDESPKSLESSDLFNQSDKDYILDQLTNEESIKERIELANTINETADWKSLKTKIDVPVRKLYWKYAAAASVLILVSLTIFLNKENSIQLDESIITNINIEPGTDKATLTLDDGSQIALEKGESLQTQNANSNGEEIIYKANQSNTKEVAYNYLTIPRGGQFFIKLSDGTQVWLNSESKLKYPINFISGKTREVELVYGEAYFDVSHSTYHNGDKFKVINKNQEIEVLGTEFNVKAYKEENNISTTLVQGKVTVSNAFYKQDLVPNQQAKIDLTTNRMIVNTVDIYDEISWKNGIFSFKGKSLKDIMKVISRWYDIDVVFENKELESITFKGVLGKDQNMEEILLTIKTLSIIKNYEINNKTIILK